MVRRLTFALLLFANAAAAKEVHLPFFPPASNDQQQGFVRLTNHSDVAGEVRIVGYSDDGVRSSSAATLVIAAGQTKHFNSDDVEIGNQAKGLTGGIGSSSSDWRLILSSELDFEALSYIRTPDGFLTAIHDELVSSGGFYTAPTFNPGSNRNQVSSLRFANPHDETVLVTVTGLDDDAIEGGVVELVLSANAAIELDSSALEEGDAATTGALGDGKGKWRLYVGSQRPIHVISLLRDPGGYVTNLSTFHDVQHGPAGFFVGAFWAPTLGQWVSMEGLGAPGGKFYFRSQMFGDTQIYVGTSAFTIDTISATYAEYPEGGAAVSEGSLAGVYRPRDYITGDYVNGPSTGTFTVRYVSSYERGVDLSRLVGTWTGSEYALVASAEISADGRVTASDTDGCDYDAQLQVTNPRVNLYSIVASVQCPGQDAFEASGYVAVDDWRYFGANDALHVFGEGGGSAFTTTLVKDTL